jgi:hypothetical protein
MPCARTALPPRTRLLLALVSVALGCGSGDGGTSSPGPSPPPATTACAADDALVDGVCEPVLPTAACQPGTRSALGSSSCVPVGTTACASGFTAHPSGWGCVPVLPPAACKGATRDSLGSTTCVPVGDCTGVFPPASATVFVDASLADAQVDATHYKSLRAAVDAAPAKATIAVSAGTYAEALDVKRPVTLVGRCAEKVILEAPAGAAAVTASAELAASGMTIRGGTKGLDVGPAVHASVADVVLEKNLRAGISATDAAVVDVVRSVIRDTLTVSPSDITNGVFVDVDAKVTLDDSVVSGAADAGLGATGIGLIALHRSVVRDIVKRSDGVGGGGARAFEGATISLEESAVKGTVGSGLLVGKTKGAMRLVRSTVTDTKPDMRFGGGFANAASVTTTGTLDATDSTFADNAFSGVAVDKAGSRATLDRCVVIGTVAGGESGVAITASAANGAVLQATSSAFVGGAGMAMYALHAGSTLDLDQSLVSDVALSVGGETLGAGHGGTAVAAIDAAHVSLKGSTIRGCHELALGALEAGTTMLIERTLVTDTKPNIGGLFGHGILGRRKAEVTVRGSVIEKSSGIGAAFAGATASLQGTRIRDNAVGVHVQEGSTLESGARAPETIDALVVFVTDDTQFDGNETRVGSGVVPLPDVLAPSTPQ